MIPEHTKHALIEWVRHGNKYDNGSFLMALVSTLSQWLLTKAYSASNVSIIGVISYTNIPFSIGFGWMLGDALPDALTYMGIGLIILGGVLVGMSKKK